MGRPLTTHKTLTEITATYQVVTPLFGGGAFPEKTAEIRLPSFKGVLLWTWRALAWRKYTGLAEIKKRQAALFGSAEEGRGKVTMRLVSSASPRKLAPKSILKHDNKVVGEGARYLAYGVAEAYASKKKNTQDGQLTRACLLAPFEIKVKLRCHSLEDDERELLLNALRGVGLLGGMGGKSRKGYGSLVLMALEDRGKSVWSPPKSATELGERIRALHPGKKSERQSQTGQPEYTALSDRTRHVLIVMKNVAPLEALDRIGKEMMRYRSWGNHHQVLGVPSEEIFKKDHDLMKQKPRDRTAHPERIVFGLPHNYGSESEDKVGPDGNLWDRRASPLLIHIHSCGADAVAVLSFLPARFLPEDGDKAKINVGGKSIRIQPDEKLWKPIHGFLDRFFRGRDEPHNAPKETFEEALEVELP